MRKTQHPFNWNFLSVLSFVLLPLSSNAQLNQENESFLHKTEFKVGYYGNFLWDNGIYLGSEYRWIEKLKKKERRGKQKVISHQLLLNGTLGYSTNFSNKTDDGITISSGVILRRTLHKGFQLSFELNPLGYYRSVLPETYVVKDNQVSKVRFPGRSYYAPSAAISLGKRRNGRVLSGWHLNLRYSIRTRYNGSTFPSLAAEFGYRFNFKQKIIAIK